MRAKLRTWMGSRRVWVVVGCLVYIGLMYGRGPFIAEVWPWGLGIAQGLLLLALLVVGWIVSDVLARYVLSPFFMFSLGDKKFHSRTPKAKEKAADSLMSVGTAVHSATWISLFVFPLTAFIQTMASGTDPVSALGLWWRPTRWSWWHTGVFSALFFVPLSMGRLVQRRALDIYDQIDPPSPPPAAPAMDSTAVETHARPSTGQYAHSTGQREWRFAAPAAPSHEVTPWPLSASPASAIAAASVAISSCAPD